MYNNKIDSFIGHGSAIVRPSRRPSPALYNATSQMTGFRGGQVPGDTRWLLATWTGDATPARSVCNGLTKQQGAVKRKMYYKTVACSGRCRPSTRLPSPHRSAICPPNPEGGVDTPFCYRLPKDVRRVIGILPDHDHELADGLLTRPAERSHLVCPLPTEHNEGSPRNRRRYHFDCVSYAGLRGSRIQDDATWA